MDFNQKFKSMERLTKGNGNSKAPSIANLKENPQFSSAENSCDLLSFTTDIHPHEPGVHSLKVRNVVGLRLGDSNRVEIYNAFGDLCGYLTTRGLVAKLIICMENGHKYKGVVSTIYNGRYEIEISSRI